MCFICCANQSQFVDDGLVGVTVSSWGHDRSAFVMMARNEEAVADMD